MKHSVYTMASGIVLLLTQVGYPVSAEVLDPASDLDISASATVSDSELAGQRAREGLSQNFQIGESDQDALLESNVLLGGVTGGNLIDRGSFSSARGFTTVIQNSGNHVIIQDTTLINVFVNQ